MAVLYADRRLGGITRWIAGDPGKAAMRVPDELKECVCYLCIDLGSKGTDIGATAFFVSVESESHSGLWYSYLVTARHNLEKIAPLGYKPCLRMNSSSGAEVIPIETDEWYYPEPESVADVAVMPLQIDARFDYKCLPVRMFATEKVIAKKNIGIGSDVLVTGLFSRRHGRQRNHPILRAGIVAAMLDEPLEDKSKPFDAYLIEIRSIGGLSGSPVFVEVSTPGFQSFYLLGLIKGHWQLDTPPPPVALDSAFADSDEAINMGIAVVTPATEVLKILFCDDLVQERRDGDSRLSRENAPVDD